jgi:NitT/TauT family transport system permease protein
VLWLKERWPLLIGPAVILGLWETASRLEIIRPAFFPPPTGVVAASAGLLDFDGGLGDDLTSTVLRLILTALVASSLGVATGLAMAAFRRASRGMEMVLAFFYPIPGILFLPLISFVAGRGEVAILFVALITPYIVISIYTIVGIREIDSVLIEAGRNYGAHGWRYFWRVLVPGALPVILAGIRISLGFTLITVVATEMVVARVGLGARLWTSWQVLRVTDMYVALVAVAVLGLASSVGFDALSRRLLPWRVAERRG